MVNKIASYIDKYTGIFIFGSYAGDVFNRHYLLDEVILNVTNKSFSEILDMNSNLSNMVYTIDWDDFKKQNNIVSWEEERKNVDTIQTFCFNSNSVVIIKCNTYPIAKNNYDAIPQKLVTTSNLMVIFSDGMVNIPKNRFDKELKPIPMQGYIRYKKIKDILNILD